MSDARFPYEPWTVTEDGFQGDSLRESESVFALGNGLIGMRGNLEELSAPGCESIQGTYLNGVFDSEPIVYGESAYGYAKNHETICSVMDAKSLFLAADGEALDLGVCDVREHRRAPRPAARGFSSTSPDPTKPCKIASDEAVLHG